MKKAFFLILIILSLSGCASWESYSNDYLKADQFDRDSFADAWLDFKDHYLKWE